MTFGQFNARGWLPGSSERRNAVERTILLFSTPTLDYAANISLTGFFLDVGRRMPLSFRLLPGQLSPMTVALVPSSQPGVRTHSKRGR
jgi:hypothetical protein